MCTTIEQSSELMHFPMISSEYGVAQVTELSSRGMFRVHEQLGVIATDRGKLLFMTFEIEYGNGFTSRDFT